MISETTEEFVDKMIKFWAPSFCKPREKLIGGYGGYNSNSDNSDNDNDYSEEGGWTPERKLDDFIVKKNEGITSEILKKRIEKTKLSNVSRNNKFSPKLKDSACVPPSIKYKNVFDNYNPDPRYSSWHVTVSWGAYP